MSQLLDTFVRVACERGGDTAITDALGSVSYAALLERSLGVAERLHEVGCAGQRVALLPAAGADFPVGFYGALLAGSTVVPLSPLHPERERAGFLETSGARALLLSREYASESADANEVERVLLDETGAGSRPADGRVADDADTALILYTSGTTGKPKGALLTHENVHALASLLAVAWGFTLRDTLLHTLPLHHLHGIGVSLLVALNSGARTFMLPRFDARRVWAAMGSATVFMGVPTQHRRLFDVFDAADAATQEQWARNGRGLRLVTSGSAALPEALAERWRRLTGRVPLERYGMTEVGIPLSNPLEGERRPGSVGLPLPGMHVRIVTEEGRDAAPGEVGEIWIAGPTVFSGYDGNPDATRNAFEGEWFRTGDTASWLPDGYVKILGRSSVDILKSGGYKLSALEIEDVLRDCPAVADVAVVGVPDEAWGDLVVAAVVPRAGCEIGANEVALRAWAKERLAAYKVPKRVVLFEELPRNALGKVQKPDLARAVLERL